ncbi:uncharacterized protein ACRADG_001297 isoform 5-T6 [Cochliomyia hominivorax]
MMSFKEFKATVCTPKVAGPHKDIKTTTTTTTTSKTTTNKSDSAKDLTVLPTTSSSSSSSSSSSTQSITTSSLSSSTSLTEETHMKLSKLFSFIDDTYRDIRRYNSGLYKDSYSTQLMKTINKYKNGCNEVFGKVLESYDMSLKLSQNIVRTIDIFKNLSSCLTDMEEYNYRICEIMSIFIVCELRLSVEAALQDQLLIAHRIIYIMRRHLVQEEENETLYNILRTLVYIPKLFNARDIMCAIFGQFIPIKPVPEVNVLPDKLYMLYIIVFYRWMMMQKDDDDKMLIVNFAESFMKPSVSLCSNNLYGAYLPMYTTHSTATRTILNNLKYYRDIRNACMIDNALKKIGSVVNLCDDDEDDDIIVLDTCSRTDFVQAYTSVLNLEPLSGSLSNIKLEEKTIVETVDLTDVEETTNSLFERHEKWLNEFQLLAKQSRESQLLLEKQQQNKEMISTAVICLDSDSEGEENEDVTESNRRKQKETEEEKGVAATSESNKPAILNQNTNSSNNCEDLFVDSYPITTTPINCDTDVESLETEEDADDETKISPRFLSGNLRTYQAKKSNHSFGGLEDKRNTDAEVEADADTELDDNDKAYRRDSIHISSTPPERVEQDEDDGTDVQDEHDDDDLLEEEEETNAYTILPTTIAQKTTNEKEIFAKQIRPMGPYPTYNNLHNSNSTNNDKVVFSQTLQRYPSASAQHQHQQHTLHHDKQYYSDGWDMKSSKKQKKKVQFNTSPLGPTASSLTKKVPLKPALQPTKYKASDAPEYFHLRGFERFSCAPSIAGSTSTSASNSTSSSFKQQEQQEHLAAAATLFRNIFDRPPTTTATTRLPFTYSGPFSPSSSSISSRSLTSPAATPNTPDTTRKKSRLPKNKKQTIKQRRSTLGNREDLNSTNSSGNLDEQQYSIIRKREVLKDAGGSYRSRLDGGPPGVPSYGYSSDDYYGVASDSDIVIKERYKNDAKLHKRCAVVITPTEELIQYERRRDKMYNEILQKQRRKLELRALEKQREKQRRRMGKREEKKEIIAATTTTASAAIATTPNSSKTTVAIDRDRDKIVRRRGRNYNEIFMSSESEFETNFQVRTRKQRQQNAKELQPLKIQIGLTETTTSLLSQIDAHLDTPNSKKTEQKEECLEQQQQPNNKEDDIIKQQQNICDINDKQQQHTKMRELNLLADIAQHLSPYQLDLPENNTNTNTNININNINTNNKPPLISPLPNQMDDNFNKKFIQTSSSTSTHDEEGVRKDKVTVTEHLIIMQSIDNLLEKPRTTTTTPTTDHEQHEQASACYASEPKLNIAAIINSSPTNHTNLLQNSENNLTIETNLEETSAPAEPSPEEILKANIPNDEALEQILEESISVLKSVASPFQQLNENETVGETDNGKPVEHHHTTTTIPLLISNVESLNHFEKTETEMPQSNKNKDEINNKRTKDVMEEQKQENKEDEEQNGHMCSSLISAVVESSMINTGDLCNISVETEITNALKVPAPLMPADLSDISLESEMSKHLPDIAEPSPVVTDMSDNSNASDVSKTFGLDSNNADLITNQTSTDITLPVLPLEMPNIPAAHTVAAVAIAANGSHETSFDSTLNTPTKLSHNLNREDVLRAQNLTNDLNTPLKFPLTDELTGDNTKNSLVDPEADNNVTKFLDLILNKTVTDAESETRDKIIKELNALTADTTIANSTETVESNKLLETPINEEDKSESLESKRIESEENKSKKHEEQSNLETALEEPQETKEIEDNKNKTESLENKELNPPKEITQDSISLEKSLTTEINGKLDINTPLKMKITAIKQTFNIKCRVRLKRLNIAEHCKTKKETWIAIPLTTGTAIATTKSHETEINNLNIKNCDNSMMDASTTSLIKKSCLKYNSNNNNKRLGEDIEINKNIRDIMSGDKENEEEEEVVVIAAKKAKLDEEHFGSGSLEAKQTTLTPLAGQTQTPSEDVSAETNSSNSLFNTSNSSSTSSTPPANTATASSCTKSKNKSLKTVTFDLSNLNEELRDGTTAASMFAHKKSNKNHSSNILSVGGVAVGGGAMGCHLKNSRSPRKLPDNTLRAAETLQIFVNTLNDSNRTPPSAEFNKKRSPIKNKCIAEDETPRPPPAATLMGGVVTPPCKKNCTEKSRSQITSSKCKDQLVSSLATPSITSITNDITTARIYTSSPLDQTLPEYDDNVDTVADTELILPTTTGSLRRKLKRPKKSLTRPEPVDDISTDGISNQPECNGEDDTDAVVDNEDDVFAEELLPIPAANEHILEEIVSARPTHMGPGTVIRDDYMNIEATATVPVYLFNDESRDLATPEPIQSSDTTNVVDSSSYLNTSSSSVTNTVVAASQVASTTSVLGNLEKSMLSPSEHEVSSTQETFYQTPTKNKQNETFGDKSSCNKEKSSSNSNNLSATQKLKMDDNNFLNKEDDQTSSTTGLLQNNQVDTTNHSPEMCTLALTPTTTTTSSSCSANMSSNRKIRKVSTHDEILYNELQQQQQQQQPLNKRKSTTTTTTTTTSCAESTSDNTNTKLKIVNTNILDDNNKTNGSLAKVEDKFKKLLKEVCKGDKNPTKHELNVNDMNTVGLGGGVMEIGDNINGGSGGGGGGSSPSTTTIINEEKLSRSKRKKQKSSKSSKTKNHNERSTKIVLKASKLAAHIPANPLIITIPKSRLLRPPPTPTPTESHEHASLQQDSEFFDIPNAKLFIEKEKDKTTTSSATALTSSTMSSLTSSASSMSVVKNNNHHQHHHQQQQLNKHAATAVHSNKIEF